MMEIGNFCTDGPGENLRCEAEERAHFGLWCLISSPSLLPGFIGVRHVHPCADLAA